jgi:MarR family
MADWGFLTSHARVLLHIARDPGARLRDIAASLGITERRAHGIITDLAEAGYVITQKDGRRNRYQIQAHLPVPEPGTRERPSARSSPCSQPGTGPEPGAPQRLFGPVPVLPARKGDQTCGLVTTTTIPVTSTTLTTASGQHIATRRTAPGPAPRSTPFPTTTTGSGLLLARRRSTRTQGVLRCDPTRQMADMCSARR